MTEQAEVPPPVFPPAAESGVEAPSRVLRWLLTLVLIAAIAGGGAWLYTRIRVIYHAQSEGLQQMTRDINALEVQGDRLESRQTDMAGAAQRNANELAQLGSPIDAHDPIVGQLKEKPARGRGIGR